LLSAPKFLYCGPSVDPGPSAFPISLRFFRLVEGEAEGRFAISALVVVVLAVLLGTLAWNGFLH
jgi:hypothetical protein